MELVSKLLPSVLIVTVPVVGEVYLHHTDLLANHLTWSGSPGSLVAPTLAPVTDPEVPESMVALEKLSLNGPDTVNETGNVQGVAV